MQLVLAVININWAERFHHFSILTTAHAFITYLWLLVIPAWKLAYVILLCFLVSSSQCFLPFFTPSRTQRGYANAFELINCLIKNGFACIYTSRLLVEIVDFPFWGLSHFHIVFVAIRFHSIGIWGNKSKLILITTLFRVATIFIIVVSALCFFLFLNIRQKFLVLYLIDWRNDLHSTANSSLSVELSSFIRGYTIFGHTQVKSSATTLLLKY